MQQKFLRESMEKYHYDGELCSSLRCGGNLFYGKCLGTTGISDMTVKYEFKYVGIHSYTKTPHYAVKKLKRVRQNNEWQTQKAMV